MSRIRPTLAKALPPQLPPKEWDSHDMEVRAVRSIRRRRLGGGLLVVALLGLALTASLTLLPSTAGVPAGGAESGSPLPELDEDRQYQWLYQGGEATEDTEEIATAFSRHMSEHHSGLDQAGPEGTTFIRAERELWTAVEKGGVYEAGAETVGSEQVYRQPTYTLASEGGKPGVAYDTEATGSNEPLMVMVIPEDGYERGAADVSGDPGLPPRPEYLVDGCENYKRSDAVNGLRSFEFSCSRPETDSGQEALAVKRTVSGENDGYEATETVVLYRADGTAVVVSMSVIATEPTDPALGSTELLRIAEAIPDVSVE